MQRIDHIPTKDACPSQMDLAAYADAPDSCSGEEERTRLEAHVARCEVCLQLLRGLAVETPLIESESRMLVIPDALLQAAMNLRAGDAQPLPALHVHPSAARWVIGMRRGLAAAATIGLMLAGYQIGQSFTAATADVAAGEALTNSDLFAFGLLDDTSQDDSSGLFAMAFTAPTSMMGATP